MKEVRQLFRPELLNRLDDIVAFKALSNSDLIEVNAAEHSHPTAC